MKRSPSMIEQDQSPIYAVDQPARTARIPLCTIIIVHNSTASVLLIFPFLLTNRKSLLTFGGDPVYSYVKSC